MTSVNGEYGYARGDKSFRNLLSSVGHVTYSFSKVINLPQVQNETRPVRVQLAETKPTFLRPRSGRRVHEESHIKAETMNVT